MNCGYPRASPFYRDIWDYKHANTESIQKAISTFGWFGFPPRKYKENMENTN